MEFDTSKRTSAWSDMFVVGVNIEMPIEFYTRPVVSASCDWHYSELLQADCTYDASIIVLRYFGNWNSMGGDSNISEKLAINLLAIGRWK